MRPLLPLCALLLFPAHVALAERLFSAYRLQAGPAPTRVVVKDLNEDGHLDLVTVDGASSVSVLLGTGDGDFSPATTYAIAAAAFRAVVADVDANGTLDIVTANPSANNVSILFGDGYGAFSAGPNLTTGTSPWGVAVGDVNGDLRPDIVTANNGTNTISVIRQTTPAGSFLAKTDFAFGNNPTSLALGDIDGDLDLDVVASRSGTSVAARLFNNGAGSFAVGSSIENHDMQIDVALVDVNGNGALDALFLCPGGVRVHLGNGNGTFQPYVNRTVPGGNFDLEVGNVNGDTQPDLLVGGGPPISLLVGNGNGTFQAAKTTYAFASGVGLGDIDEDGLVDLVGVGSDPPSGPLPGPIVLLAYSDLTFGWRAVDGSDTFNYGTDVADMNDDGNPDLVLAASGLCSSTCPLTEIWVQLGTGVVPAVAAAPIKTLVNNPNGFNLSAAAYDFRIGDFNEDDVPDVAVMYGVSGPPHIVVLLGDGAGGFTSQVATLAQDAPFSGVGDFDRDGYLDLTLANRLWRGHGDGTFELHPTALPLPGPFLVVDLDRDGKLDLVQTLTGSNQVAIARGVGDGTFLAASSFPASTGPLGVVAGDVDRDGRLDLVVSNPTAAALSVLPGDGAGGVEAPVPHAVTADPRSLAVGDLNGDGWLDIVTRGAQVSVLRSLGSGALAAAENYDPNGASSVIKVFVRDMNQDQKPDVLLGMGTFPNGGFASTGGFTFLQNMGDGITLDTPSPRPVPTAFAVWPNPARGVMRFALVVQEPGPVTLEIFDLAGRIVATPLRRHVPAGRTEVAWRGTARAGVYWARFTSTAQVVTRRVVSLGF